MKISSREAQGFLKAPPGHVAVILLFGPDAMRTALQRETFLGRYLGPGASEEMRLTRLSAGEVKAEPAALQDAMKAIGFFPGKRAVLITDAVDGLAKTVSAALDAFAEGDAIVVIEAGNLGKGSVLRKTVEGAATGAAIGIYPEPPSRATMDEQLRAAGLTAERDAADALLGLAGEVDPGDFRQIIEKLSLYCLSSGGAATLADVEAVAPATTEGAIDDVIHAVAEGRTGKIGYELQRLFAQGVNATTLVISASRHFRALMAVASDPGGIDAGLSRMRPPVFGPRRDRLARQAGGWGLPRLEQAVTVLTDTDLALRSSSAHPTGAVLERALIRISMLYPKRG